MVIQECARTVVQRGRCVSAHLFHPQVCCAIASSIHTLLPEHVIVYMSGQLGRGIQALKVLRHRTSQERGLKPLHRYPHPKTRSCRSSASAPCRDIPTLLGFIIRGFIWDIPILIFAYVLLGALVIALPTLPFTSFHAHNGRLQAYPFEDKVTP